MSQDRFNEKIIKSLDLHLNMFNDLHHRLQKVEKKINDLELKYNLDKLKGGKRWCSTSITTEMRPKSFKGRQL